MATLTTIGKKNEAYFKGILPIQPIGDSVLRIGLIEEGRPIGAMELNKADGLCDINSIYIIPDMRRKGYGSELLNAAIRLSAENEMYGLWADYQTDEGLSAFFQKNGFQVLDGMMMYDFPLDAFFDAPLIKKYTNNKVLGKASSLEYLTSVQKKELRDFLARGGYDPFATQSLLCDEALSHISFDKNDRISGVLCISEAENRLVIALLLTGSPDNTAEIITLFQSYARAARKQGKAYDTISFYADNDKVLEIVHAIVKDESKLHGEIRTQTAMRAVQSIAVS